MKLGRICLLFACLAAAACGRSTPAPGPLPGTATATVLIVGTSSPYPQPTVPATATPSPLPATSSPGVTPSAIPTAFGPRLNQILDFWFIDELHGWMTASVCDSGGTCKLGMRETLNGGQDWSVIPAPQAPISFFGADQAGGVHSVRFLDDRVGWVYGPALFASTDGGQTWQEEKLPGDVLDIQPVEGAGAWALVRACSGSGDCRLNVYQNQGTAWQGINTQPGLTGQEGRLLRVVTNRDASGQVHNGVTYQDAWVLGQVGVGQGGIPIWGLAFSGDGGGTWSSLTIPCEVNPNLPLLAAADPQALWLICPSVPGAGQQLKNLYLSTDGGQNWLEKPDPPGGGYADAIAAQSDRRAFFGLGRGSLLGTVDSGISWDPALSIDVANPGGSSGWVIRFYQQSDGWATLQNRLFRTTTSGHDWDVIEVQ